ncbi:MAG: hypothetical protein GX802_05150 [Clostridiales bacterium]|nr:hypothetical protein [Clostridiales bacterium]
MEELKPTTIEQEAVIDTITDNAPKAKKSLSALGIVLITLCVALIATAVFVAIKTVPGILMKMNVLAEARETNGDTASLYVLAKEYPYSNDNSTVENGFEISNDYFSLIIPKEMMLKDDSENNSMYVLGENEHVLLLHKTFMYIVTDEPGDSEMSADEIDALFTKHTGKRYPRNIRELNELIFSYTPDDFNIWDTEQCVVMAIIMSMKSIMVENVIEFYYYEKDGITAQVIAMRTTEKTSYIIEVYNLQPEKSCGFLCIDKTNQNRETIFKIINSIKLKQG